HPFQPDFYTPFAQFTYASRTVLVRTRGAPLSFVPALRRALQSVDPTLAMFEISTLDDVAGDSWSRLRYQTKLLSACAAVALTIPDMAVFAIIAHAVSDRRREIGIRAALGASRPQLLASIATHGVRPAALGLVAGFLVALGVGRVLASVVFGVRA